MIEQVACKYKDVGFDAIYVSPLMRTMQTANIMNKYHNVKIFKDDRLIEIDQGVFTCRSKASLSPKELILKSKKDKSCGMEDWHSVMNRAKQFVEFLKNECQYKNVLVITHSIVATYIDYVLLDLKVDYTKNYDNFANAEIRLRFVEKNN